MLALYFILNLSVFVYLSHFLIYMPSHTHHLNRTGSLISSNPKARLVVKSIHPDKYP